MAVSWSGGMDCATNSNGKQAEENEGGKPFFRDSLFIYECMCAWYDQRPEEGAGSPGEVTSNCVLSDVGTGNLVLCQEQQALDH